MSSEHGHGAPNIVDNLDTSDEAIQNAQTAIVPITEVIANAPALPFLFVMAILFSGLNVPSSVKGQIEEPVHSSGGGHGH